MSAKTVFAIMLFVSLFAMILGGLGISSVNYNSASYLNQSNTNMTLVDTQANIKICQYHSDIPILGNLVWGADCIVGGIGMLLNVAASSTSITWLLPLFIAISVTLIMIVIMILRGNSIV